MNGFYNKFEVKGKQTPSQPIKIDVEPTIGPCIKQLFEHYLPQQLFKSMHDLFNVHKFHKLLTCILSEQVKAKIPDIKLIQDSDHNLTYNEMRKQNFKKIFSIIEQSFEILGLTMCKRVGQAEIIKMIQNADLKIMAVFMQYMFQLLKHNKDTLQFITTLDEDIQNNIMEVMENSQQAAQEEIGSQLSINSLKVLSKLKQQHEGQSGGMIQLQEMENHIQRMESHIQTKDEEIKELKFLKEQHQEEMEQIRKQLHTKSQQIQQFKKRILSYEEIDQLMVQKDDEILKLTRKLADHQLKSRLRQSSLTNQNKQLNEKLSQLQFKDNDRTVKYQKQKAVIEQLNKQKEDAQISMKKVINNLKDKNKSFMDKINDLQTELTEVKFEKEIKDKELLEFKVAHDGRRHTSAVFDSPRSPLKEELNEGIESVTGNYSRLGEQLSLQLDRADLQDEFGLVQRPASSKRFNQLLQQNYGLKQQLQKMQSMGFADSKHSKELQDEINKMKKKITILKRRNDDIENQHKEEIDIMVGVIEQCYNSSILGQTSKK